MKQSSYPKRRIVTVGKIWSRESIPQGLLRGVLQTETASSPLSLINQNPLV
ncbi:hypothetical protein Oscil6304_2959 [Oscillatoria acuminata PCC 6304]|uniref:Uncharacterized protein n=1 Tax=Oscillatoria acuminata PCC 6304 TaxID=56110 RepID=K9TJH9_9CYAN|nr:hypothetical protein Oscil6304_2959 [Oscillatoria acuminata PCC 6304]